MSDYILRIGEFEGFTGYVEYAESEDRDYNWSYWGDSKSVQTLLNGINGKEIVDASTDEIEAVRVEYPSDREDDIYRIRRLMLKIEAIEDVWTARLYEKE
jgi:hypothetical protein